MSGPSQTEVESVPRETWLAVPPGGESPAAAPAGLPRLTVVANAVLFVAVMVFVVPWLMVARLVSRIRGTEIVERRPYRRTSE